ncbi:MAG: cbb3-type cytochrome c oxidase subunit 3 [Sphingomonadaceae bacterium]|nr:cbb3-type cytochrome c oxidase subunit 3 [Sphingomonadaceae bacterium]
MTYETLRHIADSWGLVLMGLTFLVLVGWTFRKDSRANQQRAAHSILERDDG